MPDGISRTRLSSINLGDFALADYIAIFSLNFLPMKKSLPMGYRGLFSCRRSSVGFARYNVVFGKFIPAGFLSSSLLKDG